MKISSDKNISGFLLHRGIKKKKEKKYDEFKKKKNYFTRFPKIRECRDEKTFEDIRIICILFFMLEFYITILINPNCCYLVLSIPFMLVKYHKRHHYDSWLLLIKL